MKKLFGAAVAALMIGAFAAAPAEAKWSCTGPDFACATKAKAVSSKKFKAATRKSKTTAKVRGGGSSGMASYYWQGTRTASGARFNPGGLTAAHRSLPFGTRVLVTNHSNGRSVVVTINDRGPFIKGRVIDLSRGAAQRIGMINSGVARVSYSVVGRG